MTGAVMSYIKGSGKDKQLLPPDGKSSRFLQTCLDNYLRSKV